MTNEQIRALLLEVEDFINEPPRSHDIEPIEVRDYRHQLYRKWTPLCRQILLMIDPEKRS